MRSFIRRWGGLAVFAVGAGLLGAAPAAASGSAVVGHVYVNDNTKGANTVAGFYRHADGALTPIPGSPFQAGGAGSGTGLASQGAIQLSSNGRFLLVVDAGSNQVSVLRIKRDGAAKLVRGGVVSSNGIAPVSIAEHAALVYVANAGTGGSNYTGFTLSARGRLKPLAHSTFALPDGSDPGDVLFNSTGKNLAGTRVGTSQIDSFSVRSDGRLRPAKGSPFTAQGPGPFGSEFRPTNPAQLFVSNAHGAAGAGTVSAFKVAANGGISSIGSSPFADHQTAPCWVEITHDGRFLFTVNTGSSSVSGYSIARSGSLSLLGTTPLSTSKAGAVDARLSPDGRDLYVDQSGADSVAVLAVSGGRLTEVGTASLPTGAAAAGIVVR